MAPTTYAAVARSWPGDECFVVVRTHEDERVEAVRGIGDGYAIVAVV